MVLSRFFFEKLVSFVFFSFCARSGFSVYFSLTTFDGSSVRTLFGGRTTLPRQSAEYSLRGYMQFGRSAAREYGSVLGR